MKDQKSWRKKAPTFNNDMPETWVYSGFQKQFSTFDVQYFTGCPNIRQRGDVGGSSKKVGKRIKELERIYGVRSGSSNTSEL